MQTYKAFLKIALKNYPSVMVYFIVFAVIAIISATQGKDTAEELYKDQEINFTVYNRDDSALGEAIKDYLSVKNVYVELEDEAEALRVALYYRDIYYAVVIPEGFEEAIAAGEDMEFMNYKVPDSSVGYYMDMYVEGYMQVLKSYIAAGYEMDEAIEKTAQTLQDSVDVELVSNVTEGKFEGNPIASSTISSEKPTYYYFYQYIPYVFLAIIITGMGPILITFGKKDVKMRINVSSQTLKSHGMQMFLGIVTFGLVVLALFNVLGFILCRGVISNTELICYLILTFCFLLLCLGIAYFAGLIFKGSDVLGGFSNVVSLGLSFLGGIFVPLEMFDDTIKNIAKFTPTYWYVQANDVIVGVKNFSDLNMMEFSKSCGILIMYALAFFCMGLAVLRYKREEA